MSVKLTEEVIKSRYDTFNSAKTKLKKDFYGIDDVIDNVFKSIETWYIYPEYTTRPTIINLWGLTGVGKTDLVRKLVTYLKIETFASTEMDNISNNMMDSIYDYNANNKSLFDIFNDYQIGQEDHSVLLLDEIHRYRTIDPSGNIISHNRYNDIWKLLSDGALYDSSLTIYEINDAIRVLENKYDSIRYSTSAKVDTLNDKIKFMMGVGNIDQKTLDEEKKAKDNLIKEQGYVPYQFRNENLAMTEYNNFNSGNNNVLNIDKLLYVMPIDEEDMSKLKMYKMIFQGQDDFIVNEIYLNSTNQDDYMKTLKYLKSCSNKVMLEFLKYKKEKMINAFNKMTDEELRKNNLRYIYSKMLIFICGNIEKEAYNNKDFDLRKHISTLFRPEQVSRFGNNYILYPVLSKDTYDKIIEKEIIETEKMLNAEYNTDKIKFNHKEIYEKVIQDLPKDYIYNGVRPIFSAVQRVLSTIIPQILIKLFKE